VLQFPEYCLSLNYQEANERNCKCPGLRLNAHVGATPEIIHLNVGVVKNVGKLQWQVIGTKF
jgi:hypothetical protein